MSAIYLIIMAVLAAVCIVLAKAKRKEPDGLKEEKVDDRERVIRVYDMEEAKLADTVDEFLNLYSDRGDVIKPKVSWENGAFKLTFSAKVDYISMCYWVNYLVYADKESKHHYRVRGWYPFGEVYMKGDKMPFSGQTVMLYVDKDDTEGDNISFVTPDGQHYLQPFAIGNNLKAVGPIGEKYVEKKRQE